MSSRQQSLTASKLGQAAHGMLAKSGKAALTWMLIGTKALSVKSQQVVLGTDDVETKGRLYAAIPNLFA